MKGNPPLWVEHSILVVTYAGIPCPRPMGVRGQRWRMQTGSSKISAALLFSVFTVNLQSLEMCTPTSLITMIVGRRVETTMKSAN